MTDPRIEAAIAEMRKVIPPYQGQFFIDCCEIIRRNFWEPSIADPVQQSEALELASCFEKFSAPEWKQAAAMLRAQAAEIERLRIRLLSAAGDDLCRLSQEEIKAYTSGAVKIPPKEEFIPSCERFHAQIAKEAGVMDDCLTLAQLVAENERLKRDLGAALRRLWPNTT